MHVDYGIYLRGEELDYNWNLVPQNLDDNWNLVPQNHFHYETQCRNIKAFGATNKTLTEARESETITKFQRKLEPTTGIEHELD